jgi:hypothetical protein
VAALEVEAHVVLVPGRVGAQRALVLGILQAARIGRHWV